ncbi:UDP-glycosyltransferase UGT40Q1 [Operophtera brumata]|uniref:UDP-glycosyltransferase UGT40Q1 n=1 Tax=Operophtera brumata TaxID=104452 RepID=A0A0L7LLD3_OPEBR|nr:UDP-glycosyltransferase UGT40Q1 [Operophtera brumata]
MYSSKAVIIVTVLFLNLACCYKILVFFPYPGKSHTILGNGFVTHLLNAGHNVTYVTPIPLKNPAPNLRQIDVSSNFGKISITVNGVMHENVQNLLMDTSESFDVVIGEWLITCILTRSFFLSGLSSDQNQARHTYVTSAYESNLLHDLGFPASTECKFLICIFVFSIASVFECPYIWSSSLEPHTMVLRLIDEIPNPAYIPDHMSPLNPPFSFWERVNELMNVLKLGRKLPPYDEVKFNGSLMFGNSHVSAGLPVPLPQNYINIGGYHIDSDTPPLPENLQKIIDNAPHGVIYFSLGTMMKGSTLPEELKRGFLRTFSGLKQTVIWKYEEKLTDLPKNVYIVEWAPQQSILVPIIGIPLFADQFINIKRAVAKGFGKQVMIGYDADISSKSERALLRLPRPARIPRYRASSLDGTRYQDGWCAAFTLPWISGALVPETISRSISFCYCRLGGDSESREEGIVTYSCR